MTAQTIVGVQHNVERLWFNSVDRDPIFWTRIQLLDGQQEAPVNTALPQHPQSFLGGTWPYICFPQIDKTCIYVFGMLPWFLENFLKSGNFFCSATAATKNALGIVEFALHPQHETSCDSEIQRKEDLKNKFRKQPGSSSMISLNSKDKAEALER